MSDADKGTARAQGALATFLDQMRKELLDKGRSTEYQLNFWAELSQAMEDWQNE